jgi:hypothetical protein
MASTLSDSRRRPARISAERPFCAQATSWNTPTVNRPASVTVMGVM